MAKKLPGLDPATFQQHAAPILDRYQKRRATFGMRVGVEQDTNQLRLVFRALELGRTLTIPLPFETIRTYVKTQAEAKKFVSRTLDLVDRRLGY